MISPNLPTRSTTARNRKSRKRQTKVLNEELGKGLIAYALAGAGFSALSPEAMAKIVYTPAYISTKGPCCISIDLNHDGTPDFKIEEYRNSYEGYISVFPQAPGNQVLVAFFRLAAALAGGAFIGPGANFSSQYCAMAEQSNFGNVYGLWANARHHYLGFEFLIAGKPHFGWARLNVGDFGATLTGYAYETVPNRPIQAGLTLSGNEVGKLIPPTLAPQETTTFQPATLGLLAQGASGLAVWRREDDLFSSDV
jgi:hypothetical protein